MDVSLNKSHDRIAHAHQQNFKYRSSHGITLIELITVIAIMATTLGIGIPGVFAMLQTNRMASAINTLSASFALARSEAITRNQEIVICKSQDGILCTRNGGWEQGWIIFEDIDGSESRDEEERLLRIQAALPASIKISFSAFRSTRYVHYWASGTTKMNGTFTFCPQNHPQQAKALILSKVGRLRTSTTMFDGSALECD